MPTTLSRADFVLIDHLQATWARAGRERLDPYLSVEREKRVFPLICQFDPTDGLYQGWLSHWRRRLWDRRGFRTSVDLMQLEDVRRVLARFHDQKDRLPVEQRDIGQYRTVDDLRSIIPTRIAETHRRSERESIKAEAYRQSQILYRDGKWMVVRLKGFAAARFWGLGTKWCTTSAEHIYLDYAGKGDLVVFLTPHGKYQLAPATQMFRDERDDPIDVRIFRGAPPAFMRLVSSHLGR